MSLKGKVLFVTGASRGIGLAIATRAAGDGAKVAIIGKTAEAHPKLPGTIFSAAEIIQKAGGEALPIQCDVRFEDQVQAAVDQTVKKFGRIDILVNNASAIQLSSTEETEMKRFDLMMGVNMRATFMCSKLCIPHLKKSENPHILMLSPPPKLKADWFSSHLAYTISKYGMSLCVLGLAEELKDNGIAVNALWPKTTIATAAIVNLLGGEEVAKCSRKPEIVADAAYAIFLKSAKQLSGQFLIDEEVLRQQGVSDFSHYAVDPKAELVPDFFLD